MKQRPKVDDVARLSGVSTATVSRVLNTPALVRPQTRERVQAAISSLGYTPNFGARALATNRSDTFGAVIPTMENAIFARGIQALQEELTQSGVTLLVATSGYDPEREEDQIQTFLGRGVDGLVLIGEARGEEIYSTLQARGVPFVLVWSWRVDCPWRCVGFDNRGAARALADKVLDYGHRRLAVIAGITRSNDRAQARLDGIRDAMTARGLALPEDHLAEAAYTLQAGGEAAEQLMELPERPTAVLCGNDVLAAGATLAFQRLGLSVPGDVSVTGFDDIEHAILVDPPLTTVHVPHRRMGRSAAELLLRLRDQEGGLDSICYETSIVERGSLARPA